MNEPDTVSERLMLEEFGRCLMRVIESANNLTGQNLLFFFVSCFSDVTEMHGTETVITKENATSATMILDCASCRQQGHAPT